MTLVTTPEHPFAKVGVGWTRAADLTRGDRVETAGGEHATVVGVEIREVQPTPVYNLTVSRTHAYFVGAQALLVHNTDWRSFPARGEP
jgi:intein/homing endonuclease